MNKKKEPQENRLGCDIPANRRHIFSIPTSQAVLVLILILSLFPACAGKHIKRAQDLKKINRYEEALEHYFKALKKKPDNIQLRMDIDSMMKEAAFYHFKKGQKAEGNKRYKRAMFQYKKSLQYDPGYTLAAEALDALVGKQKDVKSIDDIKKEVAVNIGLPDVFKKKDRVDLVFKTETSLKAIFLVLAKAGKVNILFDAKYKDVDVKLSLKGLTFNQALDRICLLNNFSYYILDDKNIVIAPRNKESEKNYSKLLMKNIFFSNVEAEEARKIIRSVVEPKRLVLNKLTNSIFVTDTVEKIALIDKIARLIDKRKGEVEIEVEILEVDKQKLKEYGTELSKWQVGAGIIGTPRLEDVNKEDVLLSVPQVVWKLFSTITNSKILARPRVRGLDKEKISIQLGEKRPIPRTTFVPVSTGGVNQQPITAYTMTDVGINVDITPTVHFNREVSIELEFQLTNVVDIGSSLVPPTLGNRRVSTMLRLRDGETGIIAGLLKGTSSGTRSGIPVLNRIPFIKELVSSKNTLNERTDILISITPRILRMPEISRKDVDAYLIGTEEKTELKRWEGYSSKTTKEKKKKTPPPKKNNKKPAKNK